MISSTDGEAQLIDAYTGESNGHLSAGAKRLTQVCYTPDGSMAIGGDDSGHITLYDAKRQNQVIYT